MARDKVQSGVGGNELLLQINDPLAHEETRLQLERIKWFCEEIVHTRVHCLQHLMLTILGSQQDRVSVGFILRSLTKATAKINTINFRKDPVEQSQPGRVRLHEQFPRLLTVFCTFKVKAPLPEVRPY